jgi:hypothetical protein
VGLHFSAKSFPSVAASSDGLASSTAPSGFDGVLVASVDEQATPRRPRLVSPMAPRKSTEREAAEGMRQFVARPEDRQLLLPKTK